MNASLIRAAPVGLLIALSATSTRAQDLARRVTAATAPNVQFHFAARPGVCGDGRTYIRTDTDSWYGSINDFTRSQPCAEGPVRVVVVRSDREPIRIETFAGTLQSDSTATDLGRVAAADAANYLMSLARTAEGRVGREALMPATLADSATIAPALLAIARDQSRSRDMRRSALSWLSRRSTARDGLAAPELIRTLGDFARDETEHNTFRQSAVSLLGRLDRGEGIPSLIEMSGSTTDTWLARQAAQTLGRSGDPRARRAVRALVENEQTPSDVRAAAIGALTGEYGSVQDAEALQRIYPKVTNDKTRDAILSGVANIGSVSGRAFLLAIVRDENQPAQQRRRAASLLDRAGVPVKDVVSTYDQVSDGEVRGTLINILAEAGTKEATAKLIAIAREDTQLSARRRAINALARFDDPAIKTALREIVIKQ
jgi:HEAT repeat protein